MKYIILFTFCFCSLPYMAYTQKRISNNESKTVELAKLYLNPISFQGFRNPNLHLKGTPFLAEKWQYAQIKVADGYSKTVRIALDLEDQLLYIKLSNESEFQIPNVKLEGLRIEKEEDRDSYVELDVYNLYKTYGDGPKGYKFYQSLHQGEKYQLLELHTKYLRKEEYIENVGIVRRPDEYRSLYEYWLITADGKIYRAKKNAKLLTKLLPEEAKRIKTIMKEQKLNLKKIEDFARLFAALEF